MFWDKDYLIQQINEYYRSEMTCFWGTSLKRTVKRRCEQLRISLSTWYRYKKLAEEYKKQRERELQEYLNSEDYRQKEIANIIEYLFPVAILKKQSIHEFCLEYNIPEKDFCKWHNIYFPELIYEMTPCNCLRRTKKENKRNPEYFNVLSNVLAGWTARKHCNQCKGKGWYEKAVERQAG